jgi:hypothetical protein
MQALVLEESRLSSVRNRARADAQPYTVPRDWPHFSTLTRNEVRRAIRTLAVGPTIATPPSPEYPYPSSVAATQEDFPQNLPQPTFIVRSVPHLGLPPGFALPATPATTQEYPPLNLPEPASNGDRVRPLLPSFFISSATVIVWP